MNHNKKKCHITICQPKCTWILLRSLERFFFDEKWMKKLNSAGNDNVNECRQTTTTAETDLIRLRNFFWSNSTFLCSNRKRVQNFHFLFTNAICQNLHLVRFGLFGLQQCGVRCCHHILPESMLINRGFILYVDVCLRIG